MVDDSNLQSTAYNLIRVEEPAAILQALVSLGVCHASESIMDVAKAGEGNMNLVLRVTTDQRSVIVKQARPWVEKYPEIAAPDDRIRYEIEFYRSVEKDYDVSAAMPSVLACDVDQRLMVLEDLGKASDYSFLYCTDSEPTEVDSAFEQAMGWVTKLHNCDLQNGPAPDCKSLRRLNHQHMFEIPLFDPPAMNLDQICDGLTDASREWCADPLVRQAMQKLGQVYLEGGERLLHGDFYPGSWLKTAAGFKVIDPEFCFLGPPEFDLGVLAAHWIFCGSPADQTTLDRVCECSDQEISKRLVGGFAGAELVRRLIGVAQLPLDADLQQRIKWLDCGGRLLKPMANPPS